jgi:transporter family-2 protein
MMNLTLLLILVVAAGAVLSIQAAINGRLGEAVGVLRSSLLTFVVGAVVTALLILFFEPAHSISVLDVPKWQLGGAFFGVIYMMVMVGAVPRVGTAVATVAVIVGQLGMGMLIDNFGWLGNPAIELSGSRILAMVCLGLALVFMYRSSAAAPESADKAR